MVCVRCTIDPTLPSNAPTDNPSMQPTEPSSAPTESPTHNIEPCGVHKYCLFEDIYPLALNVSKFEVTIQNMDESADVTYDVYFTPKIHDCIDPAISFIYEGIDYDQMDEYINITDKHGGLIR